MQKKLESVQFYAIVAEPRCKEKNYVNCSEILLQWSDLRDLSRISKGRKA